MGFSSYFLIVWDLIRYARSRGIRVGPGRGSAAGCAVAYSLRITDLDPIRYDLIFERFLNPSRLSMPDIDMDFDSRYRDEMIRYAAERYGRDHVAQIITFGTIKARNAVRDAARVLGFPYNVGDRIAKAMPPLVMGRDTPLKYCFEQHPKYADGYKAASELRAMYDTDPDVKKVVDVAKGLEGLKRSDGIHAAAVVITKEPLTEYLPVQRKPESGQDPSLAPVVTQYEMHGVESLGLLKMDFLGLRNLDVITDTVAMLDADRAPGFDIDAIALDDPMTLEMLQRGMGIGVFQLEGAPMRALMRSLQPTSFDDVAALVALYRPGPMAANMHNDYADRKNGRKPIEYLHPDLEEVLGDTYGLMIYQESVMRVAQKIAGYSLAEADLLRKAMGKKSREVIATERAKFVDAAESTGYGAVLGKQLFDIIEPFADYAFNKSHAFGYGLVAYQTAFLKAHYPVEYLACLLTSVKSSLEKAAVYISECRTLGIRVLTPDINRSVTDFAALAPDQVPDGVVLPIGSPGAITFGMSAVRNVGTGLVALLLEERDANGPYESFHDFAERVPEPVLNKRAVESLIKAGAFDSLGHCRKGLLGVFEHITDTTLTRRREREKGVMSLFGDWGGEAEAETVSGFDERLPIPEVEFDKGDKLRNEKEMLGLYVSDHPLFGSEAALRRRVDQSIADLAELSDGATVHVGGVITGLTRKFTKKGDQMAVFVLEDLEANIEVTLFPRTLAGARPQADRRHRRGRQGPSRPSRRGQGQPDLPVGGGPPGARHGTGGAAAPAHPGHGARRADDPTPPADPARPPRRLARHPRHRHPGAAPVRRVPRRHRPRRRRAAHGLRPRRGVAVALLTLLAPSGRDGGSGEPRRARRDPCPVGLPLVVGILQGPDRRPSALGATTCKMCSTSVASRDARSGPEEGTWQFRCKRTIRRRSPTPTSTNWRRWVERSASASCPRPRRTGSSSRWPGSTASSTGSRSPRSSASAARRACSSA